MTKEELLNKGIDIKFDQITILEKNGIPSVKIKLPDVQNQCVIVPDNITFPVKSFVKKIREYNSELLVEKKEKKPEVTMSFFYDKKEYFFNKLENGITQDLNTNLEWMVCLQKNILFKDAVHWIKVLKLEDKNWNLPSINQLSSLRFRDLFSQNIVPLLRPKSSFVWSNEHSKSNDPIAFCFSRGGLFCFGAENNDNTTISAFAIRKLAPQN